MLHIYIYDISRLRVNGKGLHPLLRPGSQAALGKITKSGRPNCLNYCETFIVHTHFTNVAADRIIQLGELRLGDPCIRY